MGSEMCIRDRRQVVAQGQLLEHSADADAARFAHIPTGAGLNHVLTIQVQAACIGLQRAAQNIHQRGLTGTVVPCHADTHTLANAQLGPLEGQNRPKRLR